MLPLPTPLVSLTDAVSCSLGIANPPEPLPLASTLGDLPGIRAGPLGTSEVTSQPVSLCLCEQLALRSLSPLYLPSSRRPSSWISGGVLGKGRAGQRHF